MIVKCVRRVKCVLQGFRRLQYCISSARYSDTEADRGRGSDVIGRHWAVTYMLSIMHKWKPFFIIMQMLGMIYIF